MGMQLAEHGSVGARRWTAVLCLEAKPWPAGTRAGTHPLREDVAELCGLACEGPKLGKDDVKAATAVLVSMIGLQAQAAVVALPARSPGGGLDLWMAHSCIYDLVQEPADGWHEQAMMQAPGG